MAPSDELKALVDQMPDPDNRGLLSNIDKDKVENAIAQIHKGGRDNIIGIIDMLVEPGKGNDVKPHYALHCLALHVCKIKDQGARKAFGAALASQLGGDRAKGVQKYLIREIQVAGGAEAAVALGKALLDEALCEPAAQALTAIGQGAAEQFRQALPNVKGKSRLTVIQNLGVLGDAASAGALRKAVTDADTAIRISAGWGLANIGDEGSVDALIEAADAKPGWERIQATKACLVLAEKLLAAGKKNPAVRIYAHLRDTRKDESEKYVRDVAEEALAGAK
jgi:hypothetical protein